MLLLQGDCLELLKDIPDGCVDMVLTDLPYGTTQNKWDTPIDLERFWPEIRRVTKTNAAVCLFGQMPFSAALCMSNAKEFRYEWIYQKTNPTGFLNAKKMPMKYHEQVLVFYRRLPKYNPQFTAGTTYRRRDKHEDISTNYGASRSILYREYSQARRYPSDIILASNCSWGQDRGDHPTQKPTAVLEYLIRTYTDPGETVLDATMGSGSTGVACVNTGREFIGIELEPGYFKTATDRIARARRTPEKKRSADPPTEQLSIWG